MRENVLNRQTWDTRDDLRAEIVFWIESSIAVAFHFSYSLSTVPC